MNLNHPIWNTYIDLINSDTMYFKYGLLWYCLYKHISAELDIETLINQDDYEFKKLLQTKTLNEIKNELQNRLNNAFNVDLIYNPKITIREWINKQQNRLLIHDIIKYKKKNNQDIDIMANDIYNIFVNTCKKYNNYSYKLNQERYINNKNYKRSCDNKDINHELIYGANRVLRCFICSGLIKNAEELKKDPKIFTLIKNYVKITFDKDYNIDW